MTDTLLGKTLFVLLDLLLLVVGARVIVSLENERGRE